MTTIRVVEAVKRGLEDGLTLLTPHERDVFVIVDLDNYCDMEGGFADHMANSPTTFEWLVDALQRIGDLKSYSIITKLSRSLKQPTEQQLQLCEHYNASRDFRLECLERYLRAEGIGLDWTYRSALGVEGGHTIRRIRDMPLPSP